MINRVALKDELRSSPQTIQDKMCDRHRGLVLLLWFPAVLLVSAQTAEQPCQPPVIQRGFVIPPRDVYAHKQTVSYSCDNGQKPAVEGWWATATCWNGTWSPEPKCIEESSCFQPDVIPNTRYTPSQTGWYKNKAKIQIRCDQGYETKNNELTATCMNGAWSSMPVCEKRADSCSEPPQLPHAVIINHTQEVFAEGSQVTYQCEDGYTTEQGESRKSVSCIKGNWTNCPTCKSSSSSGSSVSEVETVPRQSEAQSCTAPVLDHDLLDPKQDIYPHGANLTYTCKDGRKPADQGWWATSTCNNGRWSPPPQCIDEKACIPPNVPNGKYREALNGWYEERTTISITCDTGYEHANQDTTATCVKGAWSSGPICRRSSSSSGSTVSKVPTVPIRNCGKKPRIENGDYVGNDQMILKYRCNSYYALVGPKVVVCFSNNTWSQVPTCKAAFCALNTENHPVLEDVGRVRFIKNGDTESFKCKKLKWNWLTDHYAAVQCTDGEVQLGPCCGWIERQTDFCA